MSRRQQLTIDLRMYRMSGIGRYLQTLLPLLTPRLHADTIQLLCNPADLSAETWTHDPRIEICPFPAPIFSIAEQRAALSGLYRRTTLLWCPQYNIPLLYRGRLLVTIHDLCQLAYPETLGSALQRWYARKLLAAVAARAQAVLCVSHFTAGEVQKYLHIPAARLTVSYPVLPDPGSRPGPADASPEAGPYLLAVGNIKKHKNLRLLISAFDQLRGQIPHRLVIIGQQHGFTNAEGELSNATSLLEGRVRFTGHVSEADLRRWYRNAHALIFPSFYEGFGFPVLEAMTQGCPVACSSAASLPEAAGDAALFFDPFSAEDLRRAILRIVNDDDLRKNLVERGFRRAETFRGDACAAITADTVNRLLAASQ